MREEQETILSDTLCREEEYFLYGVKTGRTQMALILAANDLDVEKKTETSGTIFWRK